MVRGKAVYVNGFFVLKKIWFLMYHDMGNIPDDYIKVDSRLTTLYQSYILLSKEKYKPAPD